MGHSITKIIGSPEATKRIEKFYIWLKEKGYSQNSCRNIVNGGVQFLKYFGTEIKLRKSLGVYRTEVCLSDHLLTIDEVQQMADVADLREQVILEVLLLGLRVSDAARLEVRGFNILKPTPVPLKLYAKKEGTIYRTFISKEFQDLLKLYVPTLEYGTWLFPGKRKGKHISNDALNWTLQELAKRAGIKTNGNLRWHCGRKLVLRTAAELGINQWSAKALTGKSIPKDIATYIEGLDLKKDFLKLHDVLRLKRTKGEINGIEEEIGSLKEALNSVEKENLVFKARIDNLQNTVEEYGEYLGSLIEWNKNFTIEEKEAIRKKLGLRKKTKP